jgi:hypothetical protein
LGILKLNLAQFEEAESLFLRLQERTRQMGGPKWRESTLFLAWVCLARDDMEAAIALLEPLAASPNQLLDPGHDVFVGLDLAMSYLFAHRFEEAAALYVEVMPRALQDAGPVTDAQHSVLAAFCEAQLGRPLSSIRSVQHSSMQSEAVALKGVLAAAHWIAGGRKHEERASVLAVLGALDEPIHAGTNWTHVQTSSFARMMTRLVREAL